MKKHIQFLNKLNACDEATQFADQHRSLKAAWEACQRPDWMLWLLNRIQYQDDKSYRLFACWCVRNTPIAGGRTVWDLLTDERSKNAVVVAERYANGQATDLELDASWAASRDAAFDASWAASRAASWAASRAASRDASWAAARAAQAAQAAQAAKLREMFPWRKVAAQIKKKEAA